MSIVARNFVPETEPESPFDQALRQLETLVGAGHDYSPSVAEYSYPYPRQKNRVDSIVYPFLSDLPPLVGLDGKVTKQSYPLLATTLAERCGGRWVQELVGDDLAPDDQSWRTILEWEQLARQTPILRSGEGFVRFHSFPISYGVDDASYRRDTFRKLMPSERKL
ncbi:MAG TPA: hypothetical protein VLA04_01715, partial [Verrucomicrobiae bacterium]|nr:hypothetical protein [Verrucomicrobiae bacterium]